MAQDMKNIFFIFIMVMTVGVGLVLVTDSVFSQSAVTREQTARTQEVKPVELTNPLTGKSEPISIPELVGNIIKALLGIVGTLSLLMFMIGGFWWLTSAGNEERIKKGKDTLTWAILGLAITFGGYAILRFVISALIGATQ